MEKPAIQNEHGAPFQPTKLCNDIFLGYERHELTMYEKLLFTMGSMFRLYGISAWTSFITGNLTWLAEILWAKANINVGVEHNWAKNKADVKKKCRRETKLDRFLTGSKALVESNGITEVGNKYDK